MSSSNRLGWRESQVFGIGLAGLKAVVEAAEEAVEPVALRGRVSITGHSTLVVVGMADESEAALSVEKLAVGCPRLGNGLRALCESASPKISSVGGS